MVDLRRKNADSAMFWRGICILSTDVVYFIICYNLPGVWVFLPMPGILSEETWISG